MSRDSVGDLHFVGSVPLPSVEEVLRRLAGDFGRYVSSLPDGEVGERLAWTIYLPVHVYVGHPDLDFTPPTERVEVGDMEGFGRPEGSPYIAASAFPVNKFMQFRLKPGVASLRFDDMYAGQIAIDSYGTFRRLREEGVIPPHVRFQVCFPGSISGIEPFFRQPADWPAVREAYEEGTRAEIARMLRVIPAEDLTVQFDLAWELNDLSVGDEPTFPWSPPQTFDEKYERVSSSLPGLARAVPEDVRLGFHWCYGTAGGWPMTAMADMDLCVRLSNSAVQLCGRPVDYFHMPVLPDADDAFLAPLEGLDVGDAQVFLGLIHPDSGGGRGGLPQGGVPAFEERVRRAQRHLREFGIAAVCGHGRDDPGQVDEILTLTRECVERFQHMRAGRT
jgi:hypothetical protein